LDRRETFYALVTEFVELKALLVSVDDKIWGLQKVIEITIALRIVYTARTRLAIWADLVVCEAEFCQTHLARQ